MTVYTLVVQNIYKLSESYFLKAIELSSGDSNGTNICDIYTFYAFLLDDNLCNYDKARIYYKKVFDLSPNNLTYNTNFAMFLAEQKDYTESMNIGKNQMLMLNSKI